MLLSRTYLVTPRSVELRLYLPDCPVENLPGLIEEAKAELAAVGVALSDPDCGRLRLGSNRYGAHLYTWATISAAFLQDRGWKPARA